jgi:hypothetical protein
VNLKHRTLAVALLTSLALTGCTDDPSEHAGIAAKPGFEVEYLPVPDGETRVPQFIGLTLNDARTLAESLGFEDFEDEDASGDNRVVWRDANWTVVSQELEAGRTVDANQYVRVEVLKNGELEDGEPLITNHHLNETRFVGTITESGDDRTVVVDNAIVELDLIWTYDASCMNGEGLDLSEAFAVKKRELPAGTKVLVVRGDNQDKGFIHTLDTTGFPFEEPPADSVNERLVASGWWAPEDTGFNFQEVQSGESSNYLSDGTFSALQSQYAPLIVSAANTARSAQTGGSIVCLQQAAEYQADLAVAKAESDRRRAVAEEYARELERRIANGSLSCRDGDGDGHCYDR